MPEEDLWTRPDSELDLMLGEVADSVPGALWAALLDVQGQVLARSPTPNRPSRHLATMAVATFSLGENVATGLQSGPLHYALIASGQAIYLMAVLSTGYLLALGLKPDTSIDAVLNTLRASLSPIHESLEIEGAAFWSP